MQGVSLAVEYQGSFILIILKGIQTYNIQNINLRKKDPLAKS